MSTQHETASHHQAIAQNDSNLKTFGSYMTGLILSLVLTLMSFGIISERLFSDKYLYISLAALAILQLFVQSACFLRLNASAEGKWSLMPFIFSLLIIAILVSGSLWIMYNCNYYMMH